MDAGQIPPSHPQPPDRYAPAPAPMASQAHPMSVGPVDEFAQMGDLAMDSAAQTDRNRSRATSLAVAFLVHVVLFAVLGWMVISAFKAEEIELVVEASGLTTEPNPNKQNFAKRVTQDKPAAPARMATPTIAAVAVSPISLPEVTDFTEMPAFGTDFGDGFGMGGFGDGRGARFFGTSGGGNRIILVVDTSTSMPKNCGADGIEALRREINKTIASLGPHTRFNIICFGNDADAFAAQPVEANGANVTRAKQWMKDYFVNQRFTRTRTSKFGTAGKDDQGILYHPIPTESVSSLRGTTGGSRMDLALVAAFEQKPSSVFLLADGEPGTTRGGKALGHDEIVDLIVGEARRVYKTGTLPKVNCISIKGIGEGILKDIARRFEGNYKAVTLG